MINVLLIRGHVQTIFGKINVIMTELTLYQTLKIPRFTDQTNVAMSHNKQVIDTVPRRTWQ